ncbi:MULTISPECIES: helix-turn-helix transcriptional regulator [unclassified Microbulbifer]|uniref:helix-turn-helix domain-containing protein n=1 Tax=unclassified Microbulbifer TaxID=2619833 RepID=UPI0027E526B5|nr:MULTISPECIES: helix-turn-helix transcriptional regulator [unclassified Microbulbifer]
MSRLFEKIRLIREAECLSRAEFASLTGVPARTIEAIENKGNVPRGDVLEKIALKWPQYSFWLMTSKTHAPRHISPNWRAESEGTFRVFEVLEDNEINYGNVMTRPEWFDQLIFLQSSEEKNDLYALLVTKQPQRSYTKQSILISTRMNFFSDKRGKLALRELADFLIRQGRSDLIKTSGWVLVTESSMAALYTNWEIEDRSLVVPDLAKADWLMKVHMNLAAWKVGETSYEPKFTREDV